MYGNFSSWFILGSFDDVFNQFYYRCIVSIEIRTIKYGVPKRGWVPVACSDQHNPSKSKPWQVPRPRTELGTSSSHSMGTAGSKQRWGDKGSEQFLVQQYEIQRNFVMCVIHRISWNVRRGCVSNRILQLMVRWIITATSLWDLSLSLQWRQKCEIHRIFLPFS
jgi:hypothetical protein